MTHIATYQQDGTSIEEVEEEEEREAAALTGGAAAAACTHRLARELPVTPTAGGGCH